MWLFVSRTQSYSLSRSGFGTEWENQTDASKERKKKKTRMARRSLIDDPNA